MIAALLALLATIVGWMFGKVADFFQRKAVTFILVTSAVAGVMVVPVVLWAWWESKGYNFGILADSPFAGAPAPIPYILYVIDLFVPINFVFVTVALIVLFQFVAFNAVGVVSVMAKILMKRGD